MIGPFTFERGVPISVVTAINLLAANISSVGSKYRPRNNSALYFVAPFYLVVSNTGFNSPETP
jgi:hypothetical protein